MDEHKWREVVRLFEAAVALAPGRRNGFLAREAGEHGEMRALVERMLASEDTASVVDLPIETLATLAETRGAALPAGSRVGDYEIVGEIGRGGMGTVYRARDVRLDRTAALKFVSRPTRQGRARLLAEARAASSLDHPKIATVYHLGETATGEIFIAFPYYVGGTLRDLIARDAPLRPERAARIGVDVASGLAAAHAAGLVHRDVKPSNIGLTRTEEPRLLDFGIATPEGDAQSLGGTPLYASPEQRAGDTQDPRADVWGLGMVLLEMVVDAERFAEVREHGPEAALRSAPELLRPVLSRALEADPAARYADGAALGDALIAAMSPETRVERDSYSPWRRRAAIALSVAAVALAAAALIDASREEPTTEPVAASATAQASVAVLPFSSATAEAVGEYYTHGLPEELLTALARLPGIKVVARSSSFRMTDSTTDYPEIGRRLGVEALVAGRVREAGESVRLHLRLIDAATGTVRWTDSLSWAANAGPTVVPRIATAVAAALGVELGGSGLSFASSTGTRSRRAHELYLRGRSLWYERGPSLSRAVQLLDQATAEDPAFAAAHAALADAHALTPLYLGASWDEALSLAEPAARRALALDSTLASAHASWGNLRKDFHHDWNGAEASLRRALELAPNDPSAWQWLGESLLFQGRFAEARQAFRNALDIDPLTPSAQISLALAARFAGRHEEAEERLERLMRDIPAYPLTYFWHALNAVSLGDFEAAESSLAHWNEMVVAQGAVEARTVTAAIRSGRTTEGALGAVEAWSSHPLARYFAPYLLAALDRPDAVFEAIEAAVGDTPAVVFLHDPVFDGLRDDPRFARLAARFRMPTAAP